MLPLARMTGAAVNRQRGHLFAWLPAAYASGIGLYFALPAEPGAVTLSALVLLALAAGLAGLRGRALDPACWAVAALALGVVAGALRTAQVAGPVLTFRYYGPVEGRVVDIDRSFSDVPRLTLDRVRLNRVAPDRVPERVRISLHGEQRWYDPQPGATIVATAHLSPPGGPVEPGGFDFRRHAWFLRLGAVGYTRVPVLELHPANPAETRLFRWRRALAERVRAGLPEDTGGVAAAIMAGGRSGIDRAVQNDLRRANLAHLLAISGLHMGLLAGFVYGTLRLGLAAWPRVALRWPIHKFAAIGALLAAASYLALSGGNVATQRAFVMVAVALAALLADRRALSLRAVALAALIVLTVRPEALTGPGFQMSFAATVALVAVFGWLRDLRQGGPPRWFAPVVAVFVSSAVAGAATAPVAAAHFNQIPPLGLVANLLAVPVMGTVVMPAAVIAACLMPLGLEAPALWVMGQGLSWILSVAGHVASVPGALSHVPTPPGAVLPLLAFGGLLLCLWQERGRLAGLVPLVLALAIWARAERPHLLIAETGGLVGVLTDQGRALSRERGAGFVARIWLENDGDPAPQDVAAKRWKSVPPDLVRQVTGQKRVAALTDCGGAAFLVVNAPAPDDLPCTVFDSHALRRGGAVVLTPDDAGGWTMTRAADLAGRRPWSPGPAARRGDQ